MEWFSGGGAEGSRDDPYRFILDRLELFDQGYLLAHVPELAPVRKDGQADSVVGKSPVGLVESPDRVAEELESFECRACSVAHCVDMVGPVEAVVEEETEVPDCACGRDLVVGLEGVVREVDVWWWVALLSSFAEEEEFRLVWLDV